MTRIVLAGLPVELGERVRSCFPRVETRVVKQGHEAIEELSSSQASLLILDNGLQNPTALEVLARLRNGSLHRDLPVIYCLSETIDAELAKRLVRDLRVNEVLLSPVDPQELARQAGRILGLPAPKCSASFENKLHIAVAGVQLRFLPAILSRVAVVERAGVALLEGHLRPE
ncbi:MAG: hypothetical protein ACRD10_07420, partial [Terriglobia bacterium]